MFLTELPFMAILALAIIYNPYATGWVKLYPLIAIMAAAIVFSNIFLYRAVSLSRCKIKDVGLFSPRDYTTLSAGNSIRLLPLSRGKVKIYVYAQAGLPELDWMREQTTNPDEICTYRGKAQGGTRTVARALEYFDVPSGEIEKILRGENFSGDYDECTVSIHKNAEEKTEYHIKLKRTVLEFNIAELELSGGSEIRSHRLPDGQWESELYRDGEYVSTHRSRGVKKQITKILAEYEMTQSDVRELFDGGDAEIDLDLVYASAKNGEYTVRIK